MQYGSPDWQDWVIGDEAEAIKHIKAAYAILIPTPLKSESPFSYLVSRYDGGIQSFDTANVHIVISCN